MHFAKYYSRQYFILYSSTQSSALITLLKAFFNYLEQSGSIDKSCRYNHSHLQACIMAFFNKVVFAVFFTCGMILAVVGTFFLADPIRQIKSILQPQRIIAVIALLVSRMCSSYNMIYLIYVCLKPETLRLYTDSH